MNEQIKNNYLDPSRYNDPANQMQNKLNDLGQGIWLNRGFAGSLSAPQTECVIMLNEAQWREVIRELEKPSEPNAKLIELLRSKAPWG